MAFISISFVIFMVITAAAYYILPQRLRPALLLLASLYFYWSAAPGSLVWLLASVSVAYLAALAVGAASGERSKKLICAAGVLLLLGSLAYFKYFDFFTSSVAALLEHGAASGPGSLIAPVGISFYTLQAVGYIVDVRRGEIAPERNPITFAAYITFFPHIMSGPIAKASRLLPQFKDALAFSAANLADGARRFALGVFKKAVIAEPARLFVDAVYYDIARENPASVAAAALMFSIQLYFDFSAYTDMALGAGKALGFELGENFRAPYFSKSITEIWTRWHISLTSWLREYVYFPLGGSRQGFARKLLNIALVFLVSGLWHGADWGFVAWGAIFALLRIAEELWRKHAPHAFADRGSRSLGAVKSVLSRVYVFLAWSFAFIFFRLEAFGSGIAAVAKIFDFSHWSLSVLAERVYLMMMNTIDSSPAYAKTAVFVAVAFALILLALEYIFVYRERALTERPNDLLAQLPEGMRFALALLMLCAALAFGVFGSSSFVYFQF